jgi:hypothetical protein
MRFSEVSDPDGLVSLIKSAQEELPNIKVSDSPNLKESDIVISQLADEPIKVHPVTSNSSSLPVRKKLPFKGGGAPQIRHHRFDNKRKPISKTMGITCRKCDKSSPAGSIFCNNCGSMLSTSCLTCGNSKIAADSLFCNQCGSKLGIDDQVTDGITEDNFLEYVLPEYNIIYNNII